MTNSFSCNVKLWEEGFWSTSLCFQTWWIIYYQRTVGEMRGWVRRRLPEMDPSLCEWGEYQRVVRFYIRNCCGQVPIYYIIINGPYKRLTQLLPKILMSLTRRSCIILFSTDTWDHDVWSNHPLSICMNVNIYLLWIFTTCSKNCPVLLSNPELSSHMPPL